MESIRWYRGVLDIDPDLAPAHAGMGAALFRLGDYEQAVESLARAVSLRPDALPISAFHLLADALHRQRRHEEAIETYRDVLKIDPDYVRRPCGDRVRVASVEAIRGGCRIACASQFRFEPESPANADRHVAMGRAFGRNWVEWKRRRNTMRARWRSIARNAEALDSFAVLRFRQQRYEEALRLYETLI